MIFQRNHEAGSTQGSNLTKADAFNWTSSDLSQHLSQNLSFEGIYECFNFTIRLWSLSLSSIFFLSSDLISKVPFSLFRCATIQKEVSDEACHSILSDLYACLSVCVCVRLSVR